MNSRPRISIAIADDHPLIIAGLLSVLKNGFEVIGSCSNGLELLHLVQRKRPEMVLADLQMPVMDGKTAAGRILEMYPHTRVAVISSIYNRNLARELKKMGVRGYLTKTINGAVLSDQLSRIQKGEVIFEQELNMTISSKSDMTPSEHMISDREVEIIRLVRMGHTSREISNQLFISISTVETHRKNIYKKLGLNSVPALIGFANEHLL